jgi:hypothetical protein
MSPKLWIAHATTDNTFGPTKVSFQGCEDVADFLNKLYQRPLLAIPQNTPITHFQVKDGKRLKSDPLILSSHLVMLERMLMLHLLSRLLLLGNPVA